MIKSAPNNYDKRMKVKDISNDRSADSKISMNLTGKVI